MRNAKHTQAILLITRQLYRQPRRKTNTVNEHTAPKGALLIGEVNG